MTRLHRLSAGIRRARIVGHLWLGLVLATLTVVGPAVLAVAPAAAQEEAAAQEDPDDAGPAVDPWGRDPNSLSGTIEQVCGPGPSHDAAAERPGREATIAWLDETFPEVEGFAGFSCREIRNSRSSCSGRVAPESSDCWSTHAGGRAIDVMLGGAGNQDGPPVGKALGDRIVNHLLATVDGVDNYLARALGVQQLLWDGRCWSTAYHAGDGITDINELDDDCIGEHDNHIHITLSEAGADGQTSFHNGGKVVPLRVVDEDAGDPHLVLYQAKSGAVEVRGLDTDGTVADVTVEEQLPAEFTALAAPDVAGNGDSEVFAYRESDGSYLMREIREDGTLGGQVGSGELEPGFTLVAAPDVDGDGDDELLLYRGTDGYWVLHELHTNGALGPELQAGETALDVFSTSAATPDLDGDGDEELVLYRQFDGHHVVLDFADAERLDEDGTMIEDEASDSSDPADPDAEAEDQVEPEGDELPGPQISAGHDLDLDRDGEVDVQVAMAPLDVVDPAADSEAEDDESAPVDVVSGPEPSPNLGEALTAGFTAMASMDLDADGVDELALYRRADGCLAIRHLEFSAVQATEDGRPFDAPVQPCLNLAEGSDEDSEDSGIEGLDETIWLLESRDDVDPGWSNLLTAAVG